MKDGKPLTRHKQTKHEEINPRRPLSGSEVGQCVLMLAKGFPPVAGGVETYSEQVARAYLRRGWRVIVVTQGALPDKGISTRSFPEGEIEIYECGSGGQARVAVLMRSIAARLLGSRSISVVHATTWRPLTALVGVRVRAQTVLTVHGREVMAAPKWTRPLIRHVLKTVDVVVAVSTTTRDRTADTLGMHEAASGWLVAGNGLSFRAEASVWERQPSAGKLRLFTVARLVERKNVQGVLSALGELPADIRARIEYVVAGSGPMREQLTKQAQRLGLLETTVRFVGRVDDDELVNWFKRAEVFVHPQISLERGKDYEGFGLVVADAMSFGCAVLAGSDGGPRDFVIDGQTGLTVDGTDIDAIREALILLISDVEERERLARAGRKHALVNLSWDSHVHSISSELHQS